MVVLPLAKAVTVAVLKPEPVPVAVPNQEQVPEQRRVRLAVTLAVAVGLPAVGENTEVVPALQLGANVAMVHVPTVSGVNVQELLVVTDSPAKVVSANSPLCVQMPPA